MEQRTIDDGELRQWIDEWGEESHDDILPSDDEADIANRILEHHTRGEYPDDVDWPTGRWRGRVTMSSSPQVTSIAGRA